MAPRTRRPAFQVVEIHVVVDLGGGAVRRGVLLVKNPNIRRFDKGQDGAPRRVVRLELEGEVEEFTDRYASGFVPPT